MAAAAGTTTVHASSVDDPDAGESATADDAPAGDLDISYCCCGLEKYWAVEGGGTVWL